MRDVRYGRFVNLMPPEDDPDGLIGAHSYTRHAEEKALETAGYEYYIVNEKKRVVTIDDATNMEKLHARVLFLFSSNKKKVLGVRSNKEYTSYDSTYYVRQGNYVDTITDSSHHKLVR